MIQSWSLKMGTGHHNWIWEDGQHSQRPLKACFGANYKSSGSPLKCQTPHTKANFNLVFFYSEMTWGGFNAFFFFHSIPESLVSCCIFQKKQNKTRCMYVHWKRHPCALCLQSSVSETLDSTDSTDARRRDMIYTIEDTPHWYLCVFLGLQVSSQREGCESSGSVARHRISRRTASVIVWSSEPKTTVASDADAVASASQKICLEVRGCYEILCGWTLTETFFFFVVG